MVKIKKHIVQDFLTSCGKLTDPYDINISSDLVHKFSKVVEANRTGFPHTFHGDDEIHFVDILDEIYIDEDELDVIIHVSRRIKHIQSENQQ